MITTAIGEWEEDREYYCAFTRVEFLCLLFGT